MTNNNSSVWCPTIRALVVLLDHNPDGPPKDMDHQILMENYHLCKNLMGELLEYIKKLEKDSQQNSLFLENIKIHFEMLCSEEMRYHGFISPDHDIDFQVFRTLCGYSSALKEIEKLKKELEKINETNDSK